MERRTNSERHRPHEAAAATIMGMPGLIMILFLIVFLGGVLTILSPCILPVLPFVFARSDRGFLTSGLPMLLGMASTFADDDAQAHSFTFG
jgi:cytochrome c biogenesis protein CcdA